MPGTCCFISGPHTDHTLPEIRQIINIPFYQTPAVMRTICISKTQIDRHRHPKFQCFPHHIIHRLHQFCRPWKSVWHRRPHFYHNQLTLRCHTGIQISASSPISGSNPCNCSPMTGYILTWYHSFPFL